MAANERPQPDTTWTARQTLAIYAGIGALYVTLGVFIPELLFSWWEGVPFLLLCLWIVHAVWRRLA